MPRQPSRMLALACLSLAAALAAPTSVAQAATTPQQLAAQIRKALHGHGAGHVSYRISDPALGTFSHTPHRSSAPASNEKLFTSVTLLQLVGKDFHYVTSVAGTALIVHHVLHGSLVVKGSGDPTLSSAALTSLAKRLHRLGLHRVTGHLVVDDSRYSHKTRVSGWKHSFVPTESGPISAFTVDHNAWRGGRSYDRNPTLDNARRFRKILEHKHVGVARKIEVRRAPHIAKTFVSHRSGTLAKIVDATLTYSLNFNAEMMFREAGAQLSGHGSPATGRRAVEAIAKRLGVPLGTVHDGSGLSYTDRETPAILVDWLRALQHEESFASTYQTVFYALPLSCETGTLIHRMCGAATRGQVRAKTGTLTHISALSGYVVRRDDPQGLPVTFSFLATGVHNFVRLYRHIDAAVAVLRKHG